MMRFGSMRVYLPGAQVGTWELIVSVEVPGCGTLIRRRVFDHDLDAALGERRWEIEDKLVRELYRDAEAILVAEEEYDARWERVIGG